jgi:hypothetical protein
VEENQIVRTFPFSKNYRGHMNVFNREHRGDEKCSLISLSHFVPAKFLLDHCITSENFSIQNKKLLHRQRQATNERDAVCLAVTNSRNAVVLLPELSPPANLPPQVFYSPA